MKSNNYIVIQGWMCNELNLKGNELLIFALIYGFSQDGISKFIGGRKYIANTFNISLPTVDKALQGLLEKEYVIKEEFNDFMTPNQYYVNLEVVKKLYEGSKETLLGGSKETLLNNTSNKIKKNKITNSKELVQNPDFQFGKQKFKKENLFTKCTSMINDFTDNVQVQSDLKMYLQLLLEMKKDGYILYANTWKGLLRKLATLSEDSEEQHKIISQSIERGYKNFFPINSYFGNKYDRKDKPWEAEVTSSSYTKEELEELDRLDREREAQGLRTKF